MIFLNNLTTYKKTIIIACIVSIALGILLHFAYDLTNENRIIGLVAPVNESVWEHLKLILIPFTIFSIAFYFYTKQKFSNMLLATFLGNIVGMFVTVTLYYLGTMLFGNDNMVFNIITFIPSMQTGKFLKGSVPKLFHFPLPYYLFSVKLKIHFRYSI